MFLLKKDEIWKFIIAQMTDAEKNLKNQEYRDCIDNLYDVAGNIANLYLLIERGQISSDKGRLLNVLSLMFQEKILTEDFGKILRENWQLRNIAKYGYFASARLEIEDITISEERVENLFSLVKKMFLEFEKYFESKSGGDKN